MKHLLLLSLTLFFSLTSEASEEPSIIFNLNKIQQVYNDYTINYHAGISLVIGHPFAEESFRKKISEEQEAVKEVFKAHGLEDLLVLYQEEHIHATLTELAFQHDKNRNDQRFLSSAELLISSKTNAPMDINYALHWIENMAPFEILISPDSVGDKTLHMIDTGKIVMMGRSKQKNLISEIRNEFAQNAGIIPKYSGDLFHMILGYVKPDARLQNSDFCKDLEKCLKARRPHIQLSLTIDRAKIIAWDKYTLDDDACQWESPELFFQQEPNLPQKTLLETLQEVSKLDKT